MAKRWRIHAHDPQRIAALERAAGVPAVIARLLVLRGTIDPGRVDAFLNPKLADLHPPELLPGCTAAAERLSAAVADGRRIVVYGDYDVDGMTGTALLWLCLSMLGVKAGYYVPHRVDEGYGLNAEAIRSLAAGGAQLIVTVDCGIGSVAEAELARSLGVELVVTDHHEPGPELPPASAIVHPRLLGSAYPFGHLSGSGVAFKLAWALCQQQSGARKVAPRMREFLLQAIGLAALGTVADVVPLIDENRVLVHYGSESIAERPTLGLATLLEVNGTAQRVRQQSGRARWLPCEDIAFSLAPCLNAAGRLGQPQLGVELLITDRAERAAELASYMVQLNADRQSLERSILLAAGKQLREKFDPEDAAFVLADCGWHPGVIGIVAGRLAEKHHRPVVLVSCDPMGVRPGIGSARSIVGFDLHAALQACSQYLVSHGGHAAAAGLKIEEANLQAFRAAFCEVAAAHFKRHDEASELLIDAEAQLSELNLSTLRQIEQLAPFGHGNARPLLCASGVSLAEPPRTIGAGGHHLAVRLVQHGVTLRAVAFGGGQWSEELSAAGQAIDVAFRPVINAFRGRESVELHLVDWRRSGQAAEYSA